MAVQVAVLGPFELTVRDRPVAVPSGRLRALVVALALQAGRVVPVESLAEQVWGEQLPARPRAGLQTLVNRLRGLIGAESVRTELHGYVLAVPQDAVDALRFQRLVARARELGREARGVLAEALALWRGEPLEGVGCERLEREIAPALTERYLAALERLADLDVESGRCTGAVVALRDAVARHPLRESLWVRLLTALHGCGRSAEALESYQLIRTRLAEELGADPSAELQQVHERILTAEPPAGRSRTVPRQLPPDVAGFTGRAADLAALDGILTERGERPVVVALHGPGGIGKTALAVHWAHRVSPHFPDGQIHLDMRGYGPGEPVDPAAALDVVLRALGVPPKQVPAGADERSALLRTTLCEQRVLLLVDNVRNAEQVRPLLPGGGNLVIVTSRSELRGLAARDGACRRSLPQLAVEESIALVTGAIGAERAAAEPAALAELVRLCGRLPLALVIAAQQAARYPDVPVAEIVSGLRSGQDRLDALADPEDPAADPRAVFSWSCEALDAAAARAFRFLGLHPGPAITLPAAAALLRSPQPATRRLLDRLVSVHLLEQDRPGRYRFHDLLRVYAAERAAAEDPAAERQAAVRRMLDWYLHTLYRARSAMFTTVELDLAEQADDSAHPQGFGSGAEAMAWYDELRETLLAMVGFAAEQHHDRHGWQLAYLLRHFCEIRRHTDDELRTARWAVACADRLGEPAARSRAYYALGAALTDARRFEEARALHRTALDISEQHGDHAMASVSLVALALTHGPGEETEAVRWLERSAAAARRSGNPERLGHALLNLGALEGQARLIEASVRHSGQALEIYRELGSAYFQALVLRNLAEAHLDGGDAGQALACTDEALGLLGGIDDCIAAASAFVIKGRALAASGDRSGARREWREALRILPAGDPAADEVTELLASTGSGAEQRESAVTAP